MDESTTNMANKKSQQPQNQENQEYGPKHVRLLSDDRILPSISIYLWELLKHHFIKIGRKCKLSTSCILRVYPSGKFFMPDDTPFFSINRTVPLFPFQIYRARVEIGT
jgi:hypothetical protein